MSRYFYDIIVFLLVALISLAHYLTNMESTPVHSFIRLLYLIPIILGGFKHGFKGAVLISILASLIYSPHMLLAVDFGTETINELLDILLFFAVGIIVGTMSEKKNIKNKQQSEELKQHIILQQYSNSIIESIRSGVIVVNKDMFITIINQGAKEILDVHHNCIGKNFIDVFDCCTQIKDKVVQAAIEGKTIENIQTKVEKRNVDISISISIYPLTLNNINKGLVIIIDDITELKKLQLQAMRNEKLVALGELSSGIAHEIRNPLAIIKAIEQTMKGELRDNEEAIKELDMIDEEVERANRIVKALMEFAKPSKSNVQQYRLKDIINEVVLITKKYVEQRHIEMSLLLTEDAEVLADKDQLKQAFINIVFNAAEAMATGGKLKITTSKESEKWILVAFEDEGIGIDEDILKKIFNPFFTTKEQGTGLGLSIVHRILEEHGCLINVVSGSYKGTRFEIMFPIKREGADLNEKNINC